MVVKSLYCTSQAFQRFRSFLAYGLFLCCLLPSSIFPQESTHISGTIIDAVTHQPIPIVNVVVTNTPYGAVTDSTGYFELRKLPSDLYVLEFRHVAYKKRIHVLPLKPSEKVTFTVELDLEAIKLKEVEITASPLHAEKLHQPYASTVITAQAIKSAGARKLSEVLRSFEPGESTNPLARRRISGSMLSWVPYLIYLDGAYVQYIPGALDAIVDVAQIETIVVSRWVGTSLNIGPGTSDRVISITTKRPR